ncbi:hypothetical protein ACP4OV_015154 [Aristida adscensionis]
MAEVVAGLLTSAVVKMASNKISSAMEEQANLLWNFSGDLQDMKFTLESMAAVLKAAETRSIREDSVRLWLKRLKHASLDVSDMMDDYQETKKQATAKLPGILSCLPITRGKIVLANEMKKMRENLRKINEQRQMFNFAPSTGSSHEQQHYDPRETSSSDINEAQVIGRDGEKQAIIGLLSADHRKDGTMIVPIYGLGGLGKSTLAQLVYKDSRSKEYDYQAWVYVSREFDLKKIGRSIISQISTGGGQQNTDTLQMINRCLDSLLPDKKILVVLDDIWEKKESELDKLKTMLHSRKGSLVDVIVTTRSEYIAQSICTNEPYMLPPLKDPMCWNIIKKYSNYENKSNKEQLEQIGLDIAKKCGGVALAAQALGYMLKSKDLYGWSEMNDSFFWNDKSSGVDNSQENNVLNSLMLSYQWMPPILRLCFSYCAIFPKGREIIEDDLIHQWVALDFIKPSEGKECLKQLLGMSFLQHSKLPSAYENHEASRKDVVRYTMHDLVHELATSVIGDELIEIDATKTSNTNEQKFGRYALLRNYDGQEKLSKILPKKVRALHFSDSSKLGFHDGSFSSAKYLRILELSECSNILLPASIGRLLQLRCLIAPRMQNERLPECITELSKLQYLNLHGSSKLCALPESIGKLRSLTYLDLSECSELLKLPESFGDLKSLMHLDLSLCSMIRELPDSLGNLTNLQHLELSACYFLKEVPESLCGLTQLQYLNLFQSYRIKRLPEALGSLVNLKYLKMTGCEGTRELPESVQSLRNLLHLDLSHITIGDGFSDTLGCLINLKFLVIHDCNVNGSEKSRICDFIGALTNLEHLDLSWNSWVVQLPESIGNLKKLHTLNLSCCMNLKSLPQSMGAIRLKSLLMNGCSDELMEQASSVLHYSQMLPLFMVCSNDVSGCSNLHLLESVDVEELCIHSLENVRFLKEARDVKLSEKQNLLALRLVWTLRADRYVEEKDLLEELVPPRGLTYMALEGYSSRSFPTWFVGISRYLPSLVAIVLRNLPTCSNLPPLGQLPNLRHLFLGSMPRVSKIDKDFCGGKGAFRQLSSILITDMEELEWNTTYCGENGVEEFMFPMLDELTIQDCPRLRLKPCPPICRVFYIWRSEEVVSCLEELGNIGHPTSSIPTTKLNIDGIHCRSLRLFHHFTALEGLHISNCTNLTSLPESMRHLASLESLSLSQCIGLSALPEWLGELSSLKSLKIFGCNGIKYLPQCIQKLTKLQKLQIEHNQELKQWCELEENITRLGHIKDKIYCVD